MLAVGPLAILPSPLLAVVPQGTSPTVQPFSVVNGSVTWTGAGNLGTVSAATDRAIIAWNSGAFNIAPGEIFSFQVPANGGILNKVGYGTTGSNTTATDSAIVNGTLQSNGRVFILANGNILIGGGASVSTSGGLFLSTLLEPDNFNFSALGNLAFTGAPAPGGGAITIGNSATQANIVGNLGAWSGTIAIDNISVSGDLILNQRNAGAALALTGANGPTLVPAGNLTVVTNNGAISQGAGALTVGNTTSITTNGSAVVTLANAANNFNIVTANTGALTLADANSIVLGNTTLATSLTVTATNNISTNGTVVTGSGANVTLTSTGVGTINFANNSTVGGVFAASTANGNVTANTLGNLTLGAVAAPASTAAITTAGALNIGGAVSGGTVGLVGSSIGSNSTGSIATTVGPATLAANAGSIVLPNMTVSRVVANATAGSISQGANTTITTSAGTTSVFNAGTGAITLANRLPGTDLLLGTADDVGNIFNNATIELTGGSATLTNTGNATAGTANLTIGTTNLTGSLTIVTGNGGLANNGAVRLGTGFGTAAQDLTIGGALNITTAGADIIEDAASTNVVLGSVNLTTGSTTAGAITFNAAAQGVTGGGRYGQFNVTGATVLIAENTTINAGTITAGSLTLNSTAADVLLNGAITTTGAFTANANSGAVTQGAGSTLTIGGTSNVRSSNSFGVNLSSTSNAFTGVVTVVNGGTNIITAGPSVAFTPGNVTGGSLTVNVMNAGATATLVGGNATDVRINANGPVIMDNALVRNLTINTTDTSTNSIRNLSGVDGDKLTANGTVTLASSGGILLTNVNNNITGSVILSNVTGDSTVYSGRSFTVAGTSAGNLTAIAGVAGANTFSTNWNLTLGNLNVRNLSASAMNANSTIGVGGNATAGNSGNVQQASGTRVHVEGMADFATFNGNIIVANNGNNFGRVQASTGGATGLVGSGDISLTEDAGLRVGNIATTGTVVLTSRFGSVLEDASALTNITANGTNGIRVNAPNGSVQLGNVSGNTTGNITAANATASGSVQLFSTGNLTLGTIGANSLTITANAITQTSPLNIFGLASFTATGGPITLNNTANNFGPVALTAAAVNQNITVTESNTLNLRSIAMGFPGNSTTAAASGNGTLTLTSVNGDIIDTGLGGVKAGGLVAAPGVLNQGTVLLGSGAVTLTATNGNIIIDDPTSDVLSLAGVAFNGNNVVLSVLGNAGQTLVLGTNGTSSVATGNLTASSALGNIGNAGRFTVGGTAFFQTGNGNITIDQPNVGFGAVRFVGNQVRITEAGSMDILTGSSAFGPAQLISGGNINIIAGDGTVTFGNTVAFQATGDITLRQMQAVGTVSLSHTGTANLSLLSKSTDLNSRDPIDLGTGPYIGPRD